ncbi:MAG: 1,2-phenylacetyl-CoA epoxidase subunit PaaC [Bacteroidota bacterium]
MTYELEDKLRKNLFEYLIRLGDDKLILGHRLSEWCGHAPILEEDIALANIALDCIGQASALLSLAASVEGKGRSEDDLAYFRNEYQFKNLLLVEHPNIDFAYTITRQFFYEVYALYFYQELMKSRFEPLAGIAAKFINEIRYHLRHAREWMLRLGNGTEESHTKVQTAVDDLWQFTGELFFENELDDILCANKIIFNTTEIKSKWEEIVNLTLKEATLEIPKNEFMQSGGRLGKHSEHLGHLLAEMQIVARSYPGAKW